MQRTLSLEQSPPLSAVLRYFFATPVFALLAAALLLWQGAPALASRWSPSTLALTHLLTLGALGMTMAGALRRPPWACRPASCYGTWRQRSGAAIART
jgi:hypothetical protein